MRWQVAWIIACGLLAGSGVSGPGTCPLVTAKDGDTLRLRGEVLPTAHDVVLKPIDCADRVLLVRGDDARLGERRLPLERDAAFQQYVQKLTAQVQIPGITVCRECWKYRLTAEFRGRLDVSPSVGLKTDPKTGAIVGVEGFGHPLPHTRYRLVFSHVSNVEAAERVYPEKP
jgi:hypothetical protein